MNKIKNDKTNKNNAMPFYLKVRLIILASILVFNVVLIPFDIIFTVDIPSIISCVLTLILLLLFNLLSGKISKEKMKLSDKKISKEDEARILFIYEFKFTFLYAMLINLLATIIYIIILFS